MTKLDQRKAKDFFLIRSAEDKLSEYRNGKVTYPLDLVIHLTTNCNHSCDFCYNAANKGNSLRLNIDLEFLYKTLNEFSHTGTKNLTISGGGEPMKHKGCLRTIDHALEKFEKVFLYTNLDYDLNPKITDRFLKLDRINININSIDSLLYKSIRGKQANLYRVLKNIDILHEKGGKLNSTVIATESSMGKLEETVEFLLNKGLNVIVAPMFETYLRQKQNNNAIIQRLYEIKQKFSSKKIKVLEREEKSPLTKDGLPFCGFFNFDVTLGADSCLYPCCNTAYLPNYKILDLTQFNSLKEAWTSSEMNKWRPYRVVSCKTCSFAEINKRILDE